MIYEFLVPRNLLKSDKKVIGAHFGAHIQLKFQNLAY